MCFLNFCAILFQLGCFKFQKVGKFPWNWFLGIEFISLEGESAMRLSSLNEDMKIYEYFVTNVFENSLRLVSK